jgi:murein DD-endopeptidase MepM/ murein hydrolase activator NlpD
LPTLPEVSGHSHLPDVSIDPFPPLGPVPIPSSAGYPPSRAAIEAATALAAAQTALETARSAVEVARRDLAAMMADHDAAVARAAELRVLAEDATATANASTTALAALVRAMVQRGSDTTTLDALLGGRGDTDLLARLGTAERISSLSGNLTTIREQVETDTERAAELEAARAAADEAVSAFPLTEKQEALATAETALSDATDALAVASENARLAQAESTDASADRNQAATSQLAGIIGARLSSRGWATPVVGIPTDGFGPRPNLPVPGVQPFHAGTDLGAACGSPIYAASAGVVAQTGRFGTYGNWVLVDHGEGISTGYAHIRDGATIVTTGDTVTAGQLIAGVGSTGASTGCHLHLEVRVDGTAIDPLPFFAGHGITLGAG